MLTMMYKGTRVKISAPHSSTRAPGTRQRVNFYFRAPLTFSRGGRSYDVALKQRHFLKFREEEISSIEVVTSAEMRVVISTLANMLALLLLHTLRSLCFIFSRFIV
jgi:hypothetical protein